MGKNVAVQDVLQPVFCYHVRMGSSESGGGLHVLYVAAKDTRGPVVLKAGIHVEGIGQNPEEDMLRGLEAGRDLSEGGYEKGSHVRW